MMNNSSNKIKQQKGKKHILKLVMLCFSIVIVCLFGSALIYFGVMYNKYKLDVDQLTSVNNGIKVYSSNMQDNSLYNSNRSIVKIEDLPDYVLKAFVDVEDKRFYNHNGFDAKRIIKAGFVNLTTKSKSQGASTISQQLIKNALLSNEKTYQRKLKEIILAIKMEKKFDKNQILEMYLNTIYFGQNAYGIENASKIYFDKSAKDLSLSEACCLAGLIKSPAKYSPKTNYEDSINRRNLVAKMMYESKDISQEQLNQVVNSPINVSDSSDFDFSYEREAIFEACKLLNITERDLINRNYEIITNKQDDLQSELIDVNKSVISSAENAYDQSLDSVSIVASNDGRILAYFVNSNYNLHNMRRQPASILKPLAVYLPCFQHNILSPITPILDEPIDYAGFKPKNADGQYLGFMSARDAIAKSQNIPAVKALEYVGLDKAISTLSDLGINVSEKDKNLSLALGAVSNGVCLEQLLSAYMTISNYGEFKPISFIDKILDKAGNVIYSHQQYSEKVVDDASCFLLTNCLNETAKSGTAKRLGELNIDIASKTGTAFNGKANTDLYNISYTTQHTVLSWIANIKDEAVDSRLHSSAQPTEINKQIFEKLYQNQTPAKFEKPDEVVYEKYDLLEYQNNHRIVAPSTNLERYIAYDYFKTTNTPEQLLSNEEKLIVNVSKYGSTLNFDTAKNHNYAIIKSSNNKSEIMKEFAESEGTIEIKDQDIFKCDEITYELICDGKLLDTKKIRPKDYLLGLIESQLLNGKYRWYV